MADDQWRAGDPLTADQSRELLAADARLPFSLRRLTTGSRVMVPAGTVAVPSRLKLPGSYLHERLKSHEMRSLSVPSRLQTEWFGDLLDRAFTAISEADLPWRDQTIDVFLKPDRVRRGQAQLNGDWHTDIGEEAFGDRPAGYQFLFANTLPTLQGALRPGTPIYQAFPRGRGGVVDEAVVEPSSVAPVGANALNLMSYYVVHRGDRTPSTLRRVFGAVIVMPPGKTPLTVDRRGQQYIPEIG